MFEDRKWVYLNEKFVMDMIEKKLFLFNNIIFIIYFIIINKNININKRIMGKLFNLQQSFI